MLERDWCVGWEEREEEEVVGVPTGVVVVKRGVKGRWLGDVGEVKEVAVVVVKVVVAAEKPLAG